GYNFDITNSTAYDQAFVPDRGIFDNISELVNEIFDEYITREGRIEPLFAQFCDGRISQCDGMYQWGSVDLANQGYAPIEILKYYYGDDVLIVTNAPVGIDEGTFPGDLKFGDTGPYVQIAQIMLNRVGLNYPAIPQQPDDAYFGPFMESTVIKFQEIFNLPATGIIDKGTWYELRRIFNAVNKLAELASTGLYIGSIPEEATLQPNTYIQILQFFLNIISAYYPTIPDVDINGVLDPKTREALIEFQKTMNLNQTGIIDEQTSNALNSTVLSILNTLPPSSIYLPRIIFPELELVRGQNNTFVYILEQYLNFISTLKPSIPRITPNNIFDTQTETAVLEFQKLYGLPPTGRVNKETWNKVVEVYRELRFVNTAQ
ncbi:MAG: putative peptidoglycan-binding protein, partial [Bacillota bacterium]|nr:putative peptidoglycan-binding protein [Bacillota bacterium]